MTSAFWVFPLVLTHKHSTLLSPLLDKYSAMPDLSKVWGKKKAFQYRWGSTGESLQVSDFYFREQHLAGKGDLEIF